MVKNDGVVDLRSSTDLDSSANTTLLNQSLFSNLHILQHVAFQVDLFYNWGKSFVVRLLVLLVLFNLLSKGTEEILFG